MKQALWFISAACALGTALSGESMADELERSVQYQRLTVFQMVARADLVVHVRVKDGAGRYAIVEVVSALKGSSPGSELRIDFRDLNFSPQGQELVVFQPVEEYLLFLMKKQWRKPNEKKDNILDLLHGRRGRILLPPEGKDEPLDAIRHLVPLSQSGPEEQVEGLRGLLTTGNPLLREDVLEELGRMRAAARDDLPVLLRLLGDSSPGVRRSVLALLALLFASFRPSDLPEASDERAALGLVLERARVDTDAAVRVESIRTLEAWPAPGDVTGDLKAIARQDPSQEVRYEAERVLFRMHS